MEWFSSYWWGPQHTSELVRPTLNKQRYGREVVEHRMSQLSDAEKTWLRRHYDERKRELVEYSLCSPHTRFCHGTVSNRVTLAELQAVRILLAGKIAHGKNACLDAFFSILGSEQHIGVNDFGEGDRTVNDHRLEVCGQERSIIFTNVMGFVGPPEVDGQIMEALILGKLRHGHICAVEEIQARPVALHEQCLALIFVVSCKDYTVAATGQYSNRSRFSSIATTYRNVRRVIQRQDIVPITIVTNLWDESADRIRADYKQVLEDAAEVVGSAPCHIFPFENLFPKGGKGTLQFQKRLDWNRLNGLMALQEALVQAELRLNRRNLMDDEELADKKIVLNFMESMAERYAWNEARYSQVMANLKRKWLNLADHDSYLSPQDFIAICENAREDPTYSPFMSRVMSFQVLEGMEAMREEWLQQDE